MTEADTKNSASALPNDSKFPVVDARYKIIKRIGEGGFCEVFKARDSITGDFVAIKKPHANKIKDHDAIEKMRKLLMKEAHVVKSLDHPNIVKFYDFIHNKESMYIVIEYADGGDLFDWIIRRKSLNENDAARVICQILSAVYHMHQRGFVHRDIKIENVLLKTEDALRFLITDFGLSRDLNEGIMTTSCGTMEYSAPELLKSRRVNGYGPEVDSWSIGVMAYTILCGYMPFYSSSKNMREVREKVLEGKYQFHSPIWDKISIEAKRFISNLLIPDPLERMSVEKALIHPWILGEHKNSNIFGAIEDDIKRTIARKRLRCLILLASVITTFYQLRNGPLPPRQKSEIEAQNNVKEAI